MYFLRLVSEMVFNQCRIRQFYYIKFTIQLTNPNFGWLYPHTFQGGGGEGDGGDDDDDMDENLMAEEVDNTLHFKGSERLRILLKSMRR